MKAQDGGEPAMRTSERFDTAMSAILSISKPAVVAEEKRQRDQRKAERVARRTRRA